MLFRSVESHVAGVERGEGLDDIDGEAGEHGQLFGARLAVQLLAQDLARLDDAREVGGAVERNANGAALARQGRTVRVPLNRTADLSRIIKASEILRQKLNREPSPEELATLTGLSVDVVQSLAALNTSDVRLDAPMDPEGDRSLIERFVADEMPDTEEEAMNRFLTDEIEQALSTLPPRDAKVLRLYFGLEGGREHTLEEIGSMLGVTRERVRQLRDRALKRLREGDVGRALGSFAA